MEEQSSRPDAGDKPCSAEDKDSQKVMVTTRLDVLSRRDLPPFAKLVFLYLVDRQGANAFAWPKQATIAAELGMSDRQVRRGVEKLKKEGLLTVTNRGGGRSRPSHYEVHPPAKQHTNADSGRVDSRPDASSFPAPNVDTGGQVSAPKTRTDSTENPDRLDRKPGRPRPTQRTTQEHTQRTDHPRARVPRRSVSEKSAHQTLVEVITRQRKALQKPWRAKHSSYTKISEGAEAIHDQAEAEGKSVQVIAEECWAGFAASEGPRCGYKVAFFLTDPMSYRGRHGPGPAKSAGAGRRGPTPPSPDDDFAAEAAAYQTRQARLGGAHG